MNFSGGDQDLVAIIEAVGKVVSTTWDLSKEDQDLSEKEQKSKAIKERRLYVDSLVYSYINQYTPLHDNRLPPNSLFGEAINVYVMENCNGHGAAKMTKDLMRDLILDSLGRYRGHLRKSYNVRPNRALVR